MPSQFKVRIWKINDLPPDWFKRTRTTDEKTIESIECKVRTIISEVKNTGDSALVKFTKEFDKANLRAKDLRVTHEEIRKAYTMVTDEQVSALKLMKEKISANEKLALKQTGTSTSKEGITIQNKVIPIDSVGCYIPGGQAAYPSTVVMTVIPAKVAGVPRIVVCSPPNKNGRINSLVLVAADICEADEVYKIGGVQAIAALAFGTDTIEPVMKIFGPGNKYVTLAKTLVSNDVAIDMPAGPSEVLVLADKTANPKFVAADMISQAEHGVDSVAGLVTTSEKLAEKVCDWLARFAGSAKRQEIVEKALTDYGFIIICKTKDELINLANIFAPEHLEVITQNAPEIANKITSAGLILLGSYSPVSLSDYGSGTNHVLPTGGFAHALSGLSALDFTRRISIVDSSKEGLIALKNHVKVMTKAENLPNHYKAIAVRLENEE